MNVYKVWVGDKSNEFGFGGGENVFGYNSFDSAVIVAESSDEAIKVANDKLNWKADNAELVRLGKKPFEIKCDLVDSSVRGIVVASCNAG